jgi:DinB superfamily
MGISQYRLATEVHVSNRISDTIERTYTLFRTCPDPDKRETAAGWSIKEVLGHLLDSLSNNHQRLARYKARGHLVFPGYDQNQFVARANYAAFDFDTLLSLWYNYNRLLLHIVDSIPADDLSALIAVGSRPVVTISQLVEDYAAHMAIHETQVRRIIAS